MTEAGVWMAITESQTALPQAVVQYREDQCIPVANRLAGLTRLGRYAAFNVKRSVLVAETSEVPEISAALTPVEAISLTALNARQCAEFAQTGQSDPAATAPILYSVLFNIPDDWREEFDDWYDREHIPMIMGCREWAGAKRYHVLGGPYTHLALHYITCASAFDSPSLKAARLTPWRNRLVAHRWFTNVDKMIHYREGG
jgi:hypothetical protein